MSLSDAPDTPQSGSPEKPQSPERERWGTVFMGPDATRESRMDKLLNQQERELWSRGTEIEYLRRVREKATAEAKAILDKARAGGDELRREAGAWAMELKSRTEEVYAQARQEQAGAQALRLEAEQVRAQAQAEGWQAGFEAARQEALAHEERRDAAASAVLRCIQEQCGVLFAAWRGELTALTQQAVQTATGWIMSEEHARGLEQLLAQSVQALESRQYFTAHVNPDDAELMRDLLGQAQERLGLVRWAVLADPDIEVGGIRLESDAGRVENYPAMRRAVVEEALARLDLPPEHDAPAYAAATAPLPELARLPDPALILKREAPGPETKHDTIPVEAPPAGVAEAVFPVAEEQAVLPEMEAQALPPDAQELPESSAMAMPPAAEPERAVLLPGASDATGDFLPEVIPATESADLAALVADLDEMEMDVPSMPAEPDEPAAPEVQDAAMLPDVGAPGGKGVSDAAYTVLDDGGATHADAFIQLEGLDDFGDSGGLAGLKEIKF